MNKAQPPATPQCVKVALRCRPLSDDENKQKHQDIVKVNPEQGEVIVRNVKAPGEEDKVFTFDMTFNSTCKQETIFRMSTLPIIESVLQGYNGTIFAYGQTGTGKTHTMEGSKTNPEERGIIPRTFAHIFKSIEGTPGIQYMVWVSMLELYNEDIIDLLKAGKKDKLTLHEDPAKGVYVNGLSEELVNSVEQMQSWLTNGSSNRHTAKTAMNDTSSRSHSIFIIKIEMMELQGEKVKKSRFNLVDLAGSERIKKTKAQQETQQQGIYINLALSTLGQVIGALSNPSSKHTPYRDSKLTRLLQDSLGGNTKTLMIANIGPSEFNYDETLSTLRYASQAKKIKNKPKINENPKDALIREYQQEVQRLKEMLEKGGPGEVREVQKFVKITRQDKLMDVQKKIKEEEQNMLQATEEEKKRVKESLSAYNNEKKKLMEQLNEKEQDTRKQQEEQEEMIEKYKMMKQKLLQGDKQKEKAHLHAKEILKAEQEIEDIKQAERRIRDELENYKEIEEEVITREGTIKEKVEQRTRKLNDVISKLKKNKQQTNEIHEFRNGEMEELDEENRQLIKELKFINLLIENFIPLPEVIDLQKRLEFDEELDDWIIKEYEGPPIPNPGSVFGYKRPLCEFVQVAVALGDDNPRFRPDNILKLDVELIDRTTEEFDAIQISQKVSQTINIALAEDEEQQRMIANEKQPNVYIEDPHKMNKQELLKQRETNTRAKSAKKMMRPSSSNRKKKV